MSRKKKEENMEPIEEAEVEVCDSLKPLGPRQAPLEVPDEFGNLPEYTDSGYIQGICKDYRFTPDQLAEHLQFPIAYVRNVAFGKATIHTEFKKALLEFLRHRTKYE